MKNLLILLTYIFIATNTYGAENIKKVFISQFADHQALNQTAKGIVDGLEKLGFKQGKNLELKLESAGANTALSQQIATKFISKEADVVVAIATISAQSFAKYAKENKTKLVFSSVTDPVKAGLVQTINKPGNNTSGVSNFIALEPQIKLFKQIQPNLKRLGFLYNPAEVNSLSLIKNLEELCPKLGISLVLQTASKTSDMAQAATKLAGNVDAIFISNDSTALSALQSIIKAGNKAKIPVYVSDTDAVELGALAALGPNQYQVGVQTAKIIARCLNGENPGNIAVEFPSSTELYINEEAAEEVGIVFTENLKNKAVKIIQKNKS